MVNRKQKVRHRKWLSSSTGRASIVAPPPSRHCSARGARTRRWTQQTHILKMISLLLMLQHLISVFFSFLNFLNIYLFSFVLRFVRRFLEFIFLKCYFKYPLFIIHSNFFVLFSFCVSSELMWFFVVSRWTWTIFSLLFSFVLSVGRVSLCCEKTMNLNLPGNSSRHASLTCDQWKSALSALRSTENKETESSNST